MVEGASSSSWDYISTVISWALAAAGFYVAWAQGIYLAKRSEIKKTVEEFVDLLDSAAISAAKYWCSEPSTQSATVEREIVLVLSRLETRVEALSACDFDLYVQWLDFKRAVSGGQFQTKLRKKLDLDSPKIARIMDAQSLVTQQTESIFWQKYHDITFSVPGKIR